MVTENDVRLMRQRLIALEEGRDGDAKLIGAYLTVKRGLNLEQVSRRDVSEGWLAHWSVPASVDRMIVMVDHGREPVYRIPATLDVAGVPPLGSMEVPFNVPEELKGSCRLSHEPIVIEAVASPKRKSWLERFLYG